jgi:hypothetical protein
MKGRKLRNGVNLQGAFKQKGKWGVKHGLKWFRVNVIIYIQNCILRSRVTKINLRHTSLEYSVLTSKRTKIASFIKNSWRMIFSEKVIVDCNSYMTYTNTPCWKI